MKYILALVGLGCFWGVVLPTRADTSVVFNEVMYHPATNEPAMEWVELYNQMAVNVDMTGWSLDGDIHYAFPSNTIARGGGFIVIAASPATLMAATGLTNVLGPLTNQLPNGAAQLRLRDNFGRVVNELDYDVNGDWPLGPNGSGVSLAKLDHSTASAPPQNWAMSAQMGGTPGKENFPTNVAPIPLAFNELSAGTNTSSFWLELLNYGTNSLPLSGYVIVWHGYTNREYVWSPGVVLPPGGAIAISNSTLGFLPTNNDLLFLLPPTRTNVLDATDVKKTARARSPDGVGAWLHPTVLTPGASNSFSFHSELVINEIMYDHQLLPATNVLVPGAASSEQWLELYNRSTNTVDLTGWSLSGGISYNFPSGKTIAPGAYLVVAKDAATLRLSYPAIDIIGDYSGKLSHNGDTIELDDPAGNPANKVTYYPGRRWPEAASGGGSSLELMDPLADNSQPGAWAASDESAKTSWQTYSYQIIATNLFGTNYWNDFIMGLLTDGECYVDDVSLIESPNTSPVQFLGNTNFESGATGWRFVGNHMQSRVEPEPGNPANHVLHIIAGGVQGDVLDHIETTFIGGHKITQGRLYQISFRARWLSGNNLLNTRVYYNMLGRTTVLPVAALNGTPGAQNSRYATNIGPTFTQFQHSPVIPAVSQAVTVSVAAQDPQGVSTCEVWWSANGAAFSHAAMTAQGGGRYSGTIPGFAAATIVQFYVRGLDALGAVSTYPANGSNSGAIYMVADGQTDFTQGHNVRVILTPSNWGLLRAATNLMSSGYLPCTFIYDDQRAYYDLLVRLKGSMLGRDNDAHPSFHCEFNSDDLFRGVHSSMLIDTSGRASGTNPQEEICVHHMMLRAGIPEIRPDLCRVIPPYLTNTCNGVFEPRFEDEFISTAYPNGNSGTEFNMEIQYYTTSTNAAGYKQVAKTPQPLIYTAAPDGTQLDIKDYGNNKEAYRYQFQIKNHRNEDDYSRWIPFCQTLWLPNTPVLDAQSRQVMDVDEWLREYALISLVGEGDYYSFSNPHNNLMYVRPDNNRVTSFPWDVEQLFQIGPNTPLIGSPNNDWDQLESQFPDNTRRLYAHALDLMNVPFNTNYMSYWTAHYTNFLPGQNFSDLISWIPQRTSAVLSEINGAGGNSPFSVTGTNFIVTANNLVTLSGTAPVQIQSLLINGIAYPITWNSVSSWSINIPVNSLTNVLTITAYDLHGNLLTNTATVTVKYTGAAPNPIGLVVLNELMYNPLLPGASYVELFNSSANTSFDLSNWRVNGLGYTFPPGSVLGTRQYLVLVADQSAFISAYTDVPPFDVYPGTLSPNGETLTLYMPGAQTNLPEVVVDKVRYATNAPWPVISTPGVSLQLIDPAQDNARVADWATAAGTPLTNNSVAATLPAFPPLWINELQADNLTGITNKAGQRTAWLELFNPGTNTVVLTNLYLSKNYTNLTTWAFPSNATIGPGQFKVIFADSQTNLSTTNELHTSFTLSSGAGSLALSRLYSGQPRVLDYVDYTNLTPNHSYGSFPDGQPFDRQEFFYVTPGASNNGTSAPLTVAINEWMAGNTLTLLDPVTGKYSDWFELYNYGTNTANLTGYYLTDNLTNELNFQIPFGYTIPPHGFLLVWADGKNTNGTPDLHVTFKLNKSGESLGLFGSDGNPVDYVSYGLQTDDVSEGRYPDGAVSRFFMPTPTPRTNNVIPNTAPVVTPIPNQIIYRGQTLSFTATATDAQSAFQTLTFSLDPGAPIGASIDPASGVFNWAATNVAVPSTNAITVRVTDNGTPPLSGTASFSVSVLPVPQLLGARPVAGKLPLTFSTLPGETYQVQYKNMLEDAAWQPLSTNIPGTGALIEVDDPLTSQTQRFYRILILP